MGAYGRGYRLADPNNNGYMAPSVASCDAEPYTRTPGTKGYNEYCEFMYGRGWQFTRDPYLVAPFVSKGDQWFSFDDPEAIRIKSEYILSEGYAGGMFWSIETDDFQARQFLLPLIVGKLELCTGLPHSLGIDCGKRHHCVLNILCLKNLLPPYVGFV